MVCSFYFRALVFALTAMFACAIPAPSWAQAEPAATSCANPNEDARVVSAVNPSLPPTARNLHGSVTVLVEVTIGPDGKLKSATIFKSSGNSAMDEEALRVARASVYAPKTVHCVPTDAHVLFRVVFQGAPLTPPSISVPPGWQPGRLNDKSQYATLSWSDVPQHQLMLHWQLATQSIDEIRNMELKGPLPAQRAEDVRLCNGTQSGVRFFHEPNRADDRSPSSVIEVISANGVMYTASFLAYDHVQPSVDIQKALDSFCAPETP